MKKKMNKFLCSCAVTPFQGEFLSLPLHRTSQTLLRFPLATAPALNQSARGTVEKANMGDLNHTICLSEPLPFPSRSQLMVPPGRVKIPMAYRTDDRARRVTLCKRKKGLYKKAEELAKLCGVEVPRCKSRCCLTRCCQVSVVIVGDSCKPSQMVATGHGNYSDLPSTYRVFLPPPASPHSHLLQGPHPIQRARHHDSSRDAPGSTRCEGNSENPRVSASGGKCVAPHGSLQERLGEATTRD